MIDTTAPAFSSVTPTNSLSINNVTSSSDISFTTDEALTNGSITITRTSGTADASSPRTCTLTGTALNSGAHTIDLSNTTNGCTSNVSSLVSGTVYTFVFAGGDVAGNAATSVTRTGVTFDNTAPTITNVSSDKTNGSYTIGEVIDIDVTFSEAVTSTGNVTVTLETGVTDRMFTFTVSGGTTGTCNYTVQSGDTTSDLTVNSISGTIADTAGNAMSNFDPATNLAANKALVIDTTAPSSTGTADLTSGTDSGSSSSDNITSDATPDFTITCESGTTVTLKEGSNTLGTGTCASSTVSITTSTLSDASYSIKALQTDPAGNASSDSTALSVTIDTIAPVASSISSDSLTTSSAVITWSTDEIASSSVYYGLTTSYGTVASSTATSSHTVSLSGLSAAATYNYNILALDFAGNISTSTNATFTTIAAVSDTASMSTPQSAGPTYSSGAAYSSIPSTIFNLNANASLNTSINTIINSNTNAILNLKLISLQSNKQVFTNTNGTPYQFNKNLIVGSLGSPKINDVKKLQIFLNSIGFAVAKNGVGSIGRETNQFGIGTKNALLKFQNMVGIKGANGNFGPATRAYINKILKII